MEIRQHFNIELPQDIIQIKDIFKKNGFKLYVVGGAVRDALLGKYPKDFDLATDAVPDKVEEMMQQAKLRTLPTGKAFGVINVFTNDAEYEVATFRLDLSAGRRPDAVEFTTIEGDVKRRDLTINALFFDIDTSEVVDLVGGIEDLKNGVVRTVGSARERFNEDRLRILRAIRFAGRFGSDLHPDIDAALLEDASLKSISGERIRDEFIKGIVSAKSVVKFLEMINKFGLFKFIFDGLLVNTNFIEEKDVIVVLSELLKNNDINKISKQLNNLKYSIDEIKSINFLISFINLTSSTAVALKRVQKEVFLTDDQIRRVGQLNNLTIQLIETFLSFKLTITGEEIMKTFNLEPGKEVGNKILQLETANFIIDLTSAIEKLNVDLF